MGRSEDKAGSVTSPTEGGLDGTDPAPRTAAAALGQLCGGPAEASVNAAIGLLDQAIGAGCPSDSPRAGSRTKRSTTKKLKKASMKRATAVMSNHAMSVTAKAAMIAK